MKSRKCSWNRHFAEWRFRPLMRIVIVNPKIWKVNVIGIGTPPLQRIPEKKPPVAVLAPLGFKKNHDYFTRPVEKCQSTPFVPAWQIKSVWYNKSNQGRLDKRSSPVKCWFLNYVKKPSLGRVAVSSIYADRDRQSKEMESQCDRHKNTSFRRDSGNEPPVAVLAS